jgi:8-oxo-dGTP diphosphatase
MSEIWDVLTREREHTGRTAVRGIALGEGDYHLVVVVWIVDPDGRIVLTKRHPGKPNWPEYWECTGGAVLAGEDSLAGALREAKEEIGVVLDPEKGRMLRSFTGQDSIYDYWVFVQDVDPERVELQAEEVTDIMFVKFPELVSMFDSGLVVPTLRNFLDLVDTDKALSELLR